MIYTKVYCKSSWLSECKKDEKLNTFTVRHCQSYVAKTILKCRNKQKIYIKIVRTIII